jgi:hypothetical protein
MLGAPYVCKQLGNYTERYREIEQKKYDEDSFMTYVMIRSESQYDQQCDRC